MIRKIVTGSDPTLRGISKPVGEIDKRIITLSRDLEETLKAQKDPEGVGLAAPQIGKLVRIFAMLHEGKIITIINPKIVSVEKEKKEKYENKENEIMEGCLSIPHYYGPVKRSQKLKLNFLDIKGNNRLETFKGLSAQIVQHEVDHLSGVLFVDKLLKQKRNLYQQVGDEWERVDLPNI